MQDYNINIMYKKKYRQGMIKSHFIKLRRGLMDKVNWDLKALFKNEKEILHTIDSVQKKSNNFEKSYKGKIKNLSIDNFNEAISEYEKITEEIGRLMTYAFLKFAQNSKNGALYAKYQDIYIKCSEHLIFFELEFNKLSKNKQNAIIKNLTKYEFYLKSLSLDKPHQLSNKEERILLKKDHAGVNAFTRLFDESFSNMKFFYNGKKISEEEILSLLSNKNRDTRKRASEDFTKELKKHQHLLAYIYNMIRANLRIDCELRKYKSAEESRHKENKISQKSVDTLIKSTEDSFDISREYYEKKKEILKYDELYDYDRYAPINDEDKEYDFESAKNIVLDAFESFSPLFASIAKKAFDDGWIDVFPKDGKRGGAFSHPATTDTHPYILLNHTNKRRDVFTLAHELGHAIHQYLSRKVGYLSSDTPLTTAETASVFAEMIVFEKLKETLDKDAKKALLASKIEDIFATLYRQINFTTFERRVHEAKEELSCEELNEIWIEESKKMFGDSVVLTKNYDIWWSYIPHFIHSPFYCYAYSYGQLLVLAIYGLYKSDTMKDFAQKYELFLCAGGSKSPSELVEYFGFNIEDEEFWKIGLNEVRKLVDEFKEL